MSTTPAPVAERPTSVTVALAIGWISVALGVVEGIALLVLAGDETVTAALGVEEGVARTVAIIVLVVSGRSWRSWSTCSARAATSRGCWSRS